MCRTWNAGKDRKVKRYVSEAQAHRRSQFVAWVLVGIVFFAIFVGMVLGVSWGRMERDCQFMVDYDTMDVMPNYCNLFILKDA